MRLRTFTRCICDYKRWRRRKLVIIVIISLILLSWWYHNKNYNAIPSPSNPSNCESFDVVYTWVNGSDPRFIESSARYAGKNLVDPARFDDKNELKYSLRSLEKYAKWIRHVYIVTNGQIPSWLNLDVEGVSLITHTQLAPNLQMLPTFSSAAIETFIHRIPNLSERFLYLNDDIFLGEHLYPEDLYTHSDGVKVYTAWLVPDCAADCPWVYIGDGACDQNCNTEACQFDGNDCEKEDEDHRFVGTIFPHTKVLKKIRPETKQPITKYDRKIKFRKFKEFIDQKNTTDAKELNKLVENFNLEQQKKLKTKNQMKIEKEHSKIPSKDIYAQSLINTNKIYNKIYGFKSRKVLAHVGFLLERKIVDELLNKFPDEFHETQVHKFRNSQDMQFAFAYYHFLMNEQHNRTIEHEIFQQFDTDNSSTWSDREIRTLLSRIYPLPLDWAVVNFFEEVITNCSRNIDMQREAEIRYTTLLYERYEDSNIPIVSKNLILNCPAVKDALLANFGQKSRYKFNVNQKTGHYSNFKMLTSNITEVVDALDQLRRNPKKFNCINDNLEPELDEENQLIKYLLEDFYLSFFPKSSKYELPSNFRNRFSYLQDYEDWKRKRQAIIYVAYFLSVLFFLIALKHFHC